MAQTSYSRGMTAGVAGQIVDSMFTLKESKIALTDLPFGRGVVLADVLEDVCRLPLASEVEMLLDRDFEASNEINMKVNGAAIAPVTFGTDHATTAGLLVTAIKALSAVSDCSVTGRTFTIITDDSVATVTDFVVTGGTNQAVITSLTLDTNDVFHGVSVLTQNKEQGSDGSDAQYDATDIASIMRKGKIRVNVEQAVDETDAVYMRFIADGATKLPGYFRKDSDSGKAVLVTDVKFRKRTTEAGLTILEINKP
jgi:hypothetical protein